MSANLPLAQKTRLRPLGLQSSMRLCCLKLPPSLQSFFTAGMETSEGTEGPLEQKQLLSREVDTAEFYFTIVK